MTAERTRRRVERLERERAPRERVRVTYHLPDGVRGDPPPEGALQAGTTHYEVCFAPAPPEGDRGAGAP